MMKKKLLFIRFLINPISVKTPNPNSLISSTAPLLSSPITPSINTSIYNSNHLCSTHRCFSVVSNQNVGFANTHAPVTSKTRNPKLVSEMIDIVRNSNGECRSKLDSIDSKLSKSSICEILRVLSFEKVLALQFFEWIRDNNSNVYRDSDVCSLMVDNCGWLNDFHTMRALLKRFKHEHICINEKAFEFLPVVDSSYGHAKESISSVIRVFNEIGGSVRSSGVYALITMLCVTDCFELAKYVIEITEKKVNYYTILVRDKCRRGNTEEAHALINEMRVSGCEPDTRIYNYMLGCLCKTDRLSEAIRLLEEMKETGVDADEITFEIFISNACKLGKMEFAIERLDMLLKTGRVPRITTYAGIVKGYFSAGRYEEAYAFVCDLHVKRMVGVHKMLSLLVRLHQKKGDVEAAARILGEMMEKGLRPDYLNYAKTVNVLRHNGGRDLAHDLVRKFAKFRVE